ncbi:hypothetical protein NITMOv2_3945 [Nitrospira moscoviensis]|uniref:Uncharacterized protein n=1 Tax=Nitrospira moscoviensis TaxID=42253 RepID=A0A0K2GH93_NITMO|nr:hypothetical protein NITMOv2_3945 [Nitrospira moscoviensis]
MGVSSDGPVRTRHGVTDLKQILPRLNNVLKACVACHVEYKVRDPS